MSTTQEFTAPDINAEDYYERLGAPASADSADIDDHTKKYVAQYKPELSNHEDADERWKLFNDARLTLNSSDSKDDYDTFRERFGPEQAKEAYETWQANKTLGSPETVSASALGIESKTESSRSEQRQTDQEQRDSQSSSRQEERRTATREERRQERARRRREGETDVDTDSSKTYSTRATEESQGTSQETKAAEEEESNDLATFSKVVSHVRSTVDLATVEVSKLLSMLDLVVIGYLLYTLIIRPIIGIIPVSIIQTAGAGIGGLVVVGVLAKEYLDRFDSWFSESAKNSVGNHFTREENPARLLLGPGVSAVLWALVLLAGGSVFTILLLAVSVLSLYGRLRGLNKVTDLSEWTSYVEPAGGAATVIIYFVLLIQGGQVTGSNMIILSTAIALLLLIGSPLVAVNNHLR